MKVSIKTVLLCGTIVGGVGQHVAIAETIGGASQQVAIAQTKGKGGVATLGGVEEVVVTAQRRKELASDVPIAITAIDSEFMKTRGITKPSDLMNTVPGISMQQNTLSASFFIRGIGQTGGSPNNENSVAMYVDDVYMATPQMTLVDFNNLKQVTVLKGPQGTLFGRNSTGGVIQLTTRDPQHDPMANVALTYANYDRVRGEFYGTTGITESLAADLSVIYDKQFEGYGTNFTQKKEVFKSDSISVRSKVLFQPTDRTDIRISADYSKKNADWPYRPTSANPGSALLPPGAGVFDVIGNYDTNTKIENWGASLKLNQELDFAKFVSITAYRGNSTLTLLDQDTLPLSLADVRVLFKTGYITQELQLLSPDTSKLKWTLGAFYLNKEDKQGPLDLRGLVANKAFGGFLRAFATANTESYSGYAQATYPIFEHTDFTAGLRYTEDKFQLEGRNFTGLGTIVFPKRNTSANSWTWRLAVNRNFTDHVMAYVSYNRGVKSGGFNLGDPKAAPYKPETLDAYEIGLKTNFFDRKMRLNADAFYYDYKNVQVQSLQQGFVLVANAAAATIKGAELDATLALTSNWTVSGSAAFLNGKYDSYHNAVVYNNSGVQLGGSGGFDATGEDTIQTPHFTGSLSTDYEITSDVGTFLLSGSVYHYGGAWFQPGELYRLPEYTLVNGSVLWKSNSERFELQLWAKNLTDEKYVRSRFGSNGFGGYETYNPPRTYGVTARFHF